MKKKLTALTVSIMMAVLLLCCFALPTSAATKTAISKATISYTSTYTYTGKAIKPKVTVKYKGKTVSTKNYTVSYKNNKNVGVGTITVTGKGSYTGSVSKTFKIAPKKVTSLKASSDDASIKLTWNKATGATGYYVYRYTNKTWKKIATVSAATYTDKKLTSATAYKYKVNAYYKKGSTTITGDAATISTTTTPSKPTGLSATSKETSVTLSWKAVTRAKGYAVYVYKDSKWSKISTTSSTSYTVTELSADTAYRFAVRAYYKYSDKTYYSGYSEKYASTCPKKTSSLTVTDVGHDSVTLKWGKVSGATGYKVYVSEYKDGKATSYSFAKTVTGSSNLTCTVTGLDYATSYIFRVRTYFSATNCATTYSSYVYSKSCTTTYPGVQDLYVSDFTNTSVTLSWYPISGVTSYNIFVMKEGEKELIAGIDGESKSYTVSGLDESTSYTFYVATEFKTDSGTFHGPEESIVTQTDDASVDSIEVTNRKTKLSIGSTYQLTAQVLPSYAENKEIIYSSSKPAVVSISDSGLVTAHSYGTSIITVKSAENSSKQVSFTVTVTDITSTKISLPSTITLFVGSDGQTVYPAEIVPTFTPEDTTDKSFTVSASNYTYTYTTGVIIKKDVTETLKFSDYISYSNGKFTARNPTVEPNGDNNTFAFDVTFVAKDSGKSVTTKIRVVEKAPNITLSDDHDDWRCGTTNSLYVYLDSYMAFTEKDLTWESSNPEIASVDSDGNITCNDTGDVTITAYSPWKTLKASYTISVRSSLKIEQDYFEGCKPGDTYQINAQVIPSSATNQIYYQSVDSDIATVTSDGLVTILKEGTVIIRANIFHDNRPGDYFEIWFTSNTFSPLNGNTSDLFYKFRDMANSVKTSTTLRGYTRTEKALSTNLVVNNLKSSGNLSDMIDFEDSIVYPVINANARLKTSLVASLLPDAENYDDAYKVYVNKIPVAGNSLAILGGLKLSDIKAIELTDDGSYCYDIKLTLKDESFSSLPKTPSETRHGQVFDILTYSYVKNVVDESSANSDSVEMKMSYGTFKTAYHDSSLTLSVNKATGQVHSMTYDMTVDSTVTNLALDVKAYSIFTSSHSANISFTTRNLINIEFFG